MPQNKYLLWSAADGPAAFCRTEQSLNGFFSIGVDYVDSILVCNARRRGKKLGCLFTCLQTCAVHLEVAFKLNTGFFIMARMWFMGDEDHREGYTATTHKPRWMCFRAKNSIICLVDCFFAKETQLTLKSSFFRPPR